MNPRRLAPLLVALGVLCSSLLGTSNAHALRRFCSLVHHSYQEGGFGEDYLIVGPVPASKHYMEVRRNGTLLTSGYANNAGCLPDISSPAGNYDVRTFTRIRTGGTGIFIIVTRTRVSGEEPQVNVLNNLPASTGSALDVCTVHAGAGFTPNWGLFNITAALQLPASVVENSGLKPGTYNISGDEACPGAISCFHPTLDRLFFGTDDTLYGKDNTSKAIIGHEFGHFVQSRLFGIPGGGSSYCYPEGQQPVGGLCGCGHVDGPPINYNCGTSQNPINVPVNQVHCLQSIENLAAALAEGWGHFYGMTLLNNRDEANAAFPYYKEFKRSETDIVQPPVAWNVFDSNNEAWMEKKCPQSMAGHGTEMDWATFLWKVHTLPVFPYKYTFADFESLFKSVCGGTCNNADTVTWGKLQSAVFFQFNTLKSDAFLNLGDTAGVNH